MTRRARFHRDLASGIPRGAALAVAVVLLGLAAGTVAAQGPVAAFPLFGGDATESFVWVDLRDGRASLVDRLRRDPRAAAVAALSPDVFAAIGRPADQPGQPGEIHLAPIRDGGDVRGVFFAEASTGYVAYFTDVGRRGQLGTVTTLLGRPYGPLAATDGSFLLLPRLVRGKTVGFYLVHGASGRGLYLDGVDRLAMEPGLASTSQLPTLAGRPTAARLDDRDTTVGYLVIDGDGGVHHFFLDAARPEQITHRPVALDLATVFPAGAEHAADQRYLALPLLGDDDTTVQVLVVDAASGEMALVYHPAGTAQPPSLFDLRPDLDDLLPATDLRSLALVPRAEGSGATVGLWILEGRSRTVLYVDRPGIPDEIAVTRVALSGG